MPKIAKRGKITTWEMAGAFPVGLPARTFLQAVYVLLRVRNEIGET